MFYLKTEKLVMVVIRAPGLLEDPGTVHLKPHPEQPQPGNRPRPRVLHNNLNNLRPLQITEIVNKVFEILF